jgi:8-oxo-dGTP pyrophosphatase MutT (NUDIX family)
MKEFVRVLIKNSNDEFLIVNQLNGGANFPGGKIEENESIEDAAKREVFEETGLLINSLKIVHNDLFKLGNDDWNGYFLTATSYEGEPINKEPEKIKEIGFKDRVWINKYASEVFVVNVLAYIESKETTSFKRKI